MLWRIMNRAVSTMRQKKHSRGVSFCSGHQKKGREAVEGFPLFREVELQHGIACEMT